MANIIDITDMTDTELDALLGIKDSDEVITAVVTAPGPKCVTTTTRFADGSALVVVNNHSDGYTTVTMYGAGKLPGQFPR